MRGKFFAVALLASSVGLVLVMQFTTPGKAGPLGILAVFGLMYVSVLCVLNFLIILISKFAVKYDVLFSSRKPVTPITNIKAYYFASVLALGPVMLLGMQSVGGVGVYELGLVAIFLGTSCIYVGKRVN